MNYEKFSLRRGDYGSIDSYLLYLNEEIAIRAKTLAQASTYNLEECCGCYELFDLYLKKEQMELENVEVEDLDVPVTYDITVTEVGGNGDYYVLDGYHRKANHEVGFAGIAPTGTNVSGVTITYGITEDDIVGIISSINGVYYFAFAMPASDVLITITYGAQLSGTDWKMIWQNNECMSEDFLTERVFTLEWSCTADPRFDFVCPVCTSENTLYKFIWQRDVCISTEHTFGLEWEGDTCNSDPTIYKLIWTDEACIGADTTYVMTWENLDCIGLPQSGGDIEWKVYWEQRTCDSREHTFEVAWESDAYTCDSSIVNAKFFRIYPESDTSDDYGYIGSGTYGTISPDDVYDTETISEFYGSETDDAVYLEFTGGVQYDSNTELRIKLRPQSSEFPEFNVLLVWDAGATAYVLNSIYVAATIEDIAGKNDYMDIAIYEDGFGGDESATVDSFIGTNILIDTLSMTEFPAGYGAFPMSFKVVGGADHGKSFVATGDAGLEGEYIILVCADTISQASVTDVILNPDVD